MSSDHYSVIDSSSRLSNGETVAAKTMVVQDSEASSTPCKDSTLVMRQVTHTQRHTHTPGSCWTRYSRCLYLQVSEFDKTHLHTLVSVHRTDTAVVSGRTAALWAEPLLYSYCDHTCLIKVLACDCICGVCIQAQNSRTLQKDSCR